MNPSTLWEMHCIFFSILGRYRSNLLLNSKTLQNEIKENSRSFDWNIIKEFELNMKKSCRLITAADSSLISNYSSIPSPRAEEMVKLKTKQGLFCNALFVLIYKICLWILIHQKEKRRKRKLWTLQQLVIEYYWQNF